jgi:hypothetical protein
MSADFDSSIQPNLFVPVGLTDCNRGISEDTVLALKADGFTIDGPLGKGGFGIVFAAREKNTNRKLAIKILDEPANERKRAQFRREHRVLASETLPLHIAPHLRYAKEFPPESGIQSYLVMEQIDGQTVGEYARKNKLSIERKIDSPNASSRHSPHSTSGASCMLIRRQKTLWSSRAIEFGSSTSVAPAICQPCSFRSRRKRNAAVRTAFRRWRG